MHSKQLANTENFPRKLNFIKRNRANGLWVLKRYKCSMCLKKNKIRVREEMARD